MAARHVDRRLRRPRASTRGRPHARTVPPAAPPVEVEKRVHYPTDPALTGLDGVESTRSFSRNGFSPGLAVFKESADLYFMRQRVLGRLEGVFSLIIMSESEIIGVRDPFGCRPLVLGKLDGAYILASETCAFDLVHAEFIREVEPGEVVIISEDGIRSERPFPPEEQAFGMVEYVYFSRPDSRRGGINVA